MAGNKAVTGLPTVPSPIGGLLYVVKGSVDYAVPVGGPQGLAYLDALGNIPPSFIDITWSDVGGKPTTVAGYSITDLPWALVSGEPVFTQRWPTYAEVTGKPTTFVPVAHTHAAGDIVSGVLASGRLGSGTASTSTWLRGDGSWASIPSVSTVDWGMIINEPIYTQRWPSWTEVTSKPTTFPPSGHGHAWTDISGEPVYTTRWPSYAEVVDKPTLGTSSAIDYDAGVSGNSIVRRDGSGDIHARLFRSEYTPTNATPDFIMTQNNQTTDNYIRPSTPVQVETMLGTTGTAANRLVKRDGSGVSTSTDFTSTSDERLKRDITPVLPRARLSSLLNFVSFVWRETDKKALGLIAQQVQEVAPEYVHEGADGYLSIDKASLVLEVVLGLAARVQELEAESNGKA